MSISFSGPFSLQGRDRKNAEDGILDHTASRERFRTGRDRFVAHMTRLQSMREEKERLYEETDGFKARIKSAPHVRDVIEKLSRLGQGRALMQFETLLNAAVADVMEDTSKHVELELDSSSRGYGSAELNIYVKRPGGMELLEYNGGSFNNVISLTSRIFAVIRSRSLRNFLALDEADCHIRSPRKDNGQQGDTPSTSRRFYNALYRLSRQTGVQSLAITHHDTEIFSGIGEQDSEIEGKPNINVIRVIRNEQSGNHVREDIEGPKWEDDETPGIRSVVLENIANYHKSTFHLSPGVNIVTGAHDIGKSQLVNALRLIFYRQGQGGSRTAAHIIRHGQKNAAIRVMIEKGLELVLTIRKKTSKSGGKVSVRGDMTWEIYDHMNLDSNGKPQIHEFEGNRCSGGVGNAVPDWIGRVSGIMLGGEEGNGKGGDIPVQIAEQSQPGFLGANTKPRDRAQILSIGQNVDIPRRMKEDNERELLEAQRGIRKNETRIKELSEKIAVITPLINSLQGVVNATGHAIDRIAELEKWHEFTISVSRRLSAEQERYLEAGKRHEVMKNIPASMDTENRPMAFDRAFSSLNGNWNRIVENRERIKALSDVPRKLEDRDAVTLVRYGKRCESLHESIVRARRIASVLEDTPAPGTISGNMQSMEEFARRLVASSGRYLGLSRSVSILEAVPPVEATEGVDDAGRNILSMNHNLQVVEQKAETCRKAKGSERGAREHHDRAKQDYQALVDEIGVCPLCHGNISVGSCHDHEMKDA